MDAAEGRAEGRARWAPAVRRAPPRCASRAERSASSQTAGASRSSAPSRAAHPAASSAGSARRSAAARRVGSFQPRRGSIDDLVGPPTPRARPAAACWSASRRSAGRGPGRPRVGSASSRSEQVVGGDHDASGRGGRSAAARSARRGSGSRRRAASCASGSRSSGSSWRPATITPEIASRDVPGDLVEQELGGLDVVGRHRGQRTRRRAPPARADRWRSPRPRSGIGASGSRQARLRWTGPGRGSPRAAAKARQAVER